MNILEYLKQEKEERSWTEIAAALEGGADFRILLFLIDSGLVKQRQIGEHLYYSLAQYTKTCQNMKTTMPH